MRKLSAPQPAIVGGARAVFCTFLLLGMIMGSSWGVESAGGQVKAYLKLSKNEATIGERVRAMIVAEGPQGTIFTFPELQSVLAPLSVSNVRKGQEIKEGETVRQELTFDVASYNTEKIDTPELELTYELKGTQGKAKIAPVTLTIRSVLKSESEEIADIKGPARIPADYSVLIRWILISAAVAAVAAIAFYLVQRYRKRRKVIPVEDIFALTPPHDWAYAELDKLMGKKLLEQSLFKEFYVLLTEILKRYLEGRYRIDTMEKTTDEVMDIMALARIERKIRAEVESVLKMSDMVKFARSIPTLEQSKEIIQEVYTFIDRTKPYAENLPAQGMTTGGEKA